MMCVIIQYACIKLRHKNGYNTKMSVFVFMFHLGLHYKDLIWVNYLRKNIDKEILKWN